MNTRYPFYASFLLALTAAVSLFVLTAGTSFPQKTFSQLLEDLVAQLDAFQERMPEDRVYVHMDRPFYEPGETLWFSVYVRNGWNLMPSTQSGIVHVELIDPRGTIAKKHQLIVKDGIAKGDFVLGESAAGGMYKVRAFTEWQKNDPEPAIFEKEIQVQAVILPRLKMKLDFEREAYGPGAKVATELTLQTNENEPLGNFSYSYVVNIDGNAVHKASGTTSSKGIAILDFDLPQKLASNDGLVNVQIDYQGFTESISRSIPIVLNDIDLAFFPEGGDMVEGITGKIGFKATDEFGKPADVQGIILNGNQDTVSDFSSYHMGMGAFEVKPGAFERYTAKITEPKGIEKTFALPEVWSKGYSLSVVNAEKNLAVVKIQSTESETLHLIATVRGKSYYTSKIDLTSGYRTLRIPLDDFPVGVAQFTLFDQKGIPRCERLAFVNKHRQLKVNIETNKEKYLPREKVEVTVQITDERGISMPATFSVSVADDQLLAFADDKSSNILSWLLMESDIKGEVKEPNFYFDPKEEKAAQALDYLMMTAGWRRFTWKEIRSNQPMAIKHSAEQNQIKGKVVDKDGNPIWGSLVKGPEGVMTKTDINGNFALQGINLYGPAEIEVVSNDKELRKKMTVRNYNDFYTCALRPTVRGIIRTEDGEPLFGATVLYQNTAIGALTDVDGRFELPANEGGNLIVSYVGFASKQVAVGNASEIAIELSNNNVMLDEVVVVAAGQERRRLLNVGAAVQSLSGRVAGAKARPQKSARNKNRRKQKEMDARPAPPMVQEAQAPPPPVPMDQEKAEAAPMIDADDFVPEMEEVIAEGIAFNEDNRAGDGFFMDDIEVIDGLMARQDKKSEPVQTQTLFYRAREFASVSYKNEERKPIETRTDFRKTLYWNGQIETDRHGKAQLEFYASDAISSFNITVEGISVDGNIGRAEKKIYTQLPFSLATRLPKQLVNQDTFIMPLTLINNTSESITGNLELDIPEGMILVNSWPKSLKIPANQTITKYIPFRVTATQGLDTLAVGFKSRGFSDRTEQPLRFSPKGFPASISYSGDKLEAIYKVDLSQAVSGSIDVQLNAYPSSLSEMLSGLESMLREPHGCFEQTSSSTYPNILVLNYLRETDQANPAVSKRALYLIKKGYNRLITFETSQHGFEWFGKAPGHEGLTAYGLMEFVDMEKVYDGVDREMIDRTANWLLDRRDGNGGFKRNSRALHYFGMSDNETMGIYITYALTEAGYTGIRKEVEKSYEIAMKTRKPYQLGLAANILYNYNEPQKAAKVLEALFETQQNEGNWIHQASLRSAPGSSGQALTIETTSLALLAMLKAPKKNFSHIRKAADFLRSSRSSYGGFGSTNSTVLALRALIEYAKFSKQTSESGTLKFYVDGEKVSEHSYEKGESGTLSMPDLAQYIDAGKHTFKVSFAGTKTALPYSLGINWHTSLPQSHPDCVVQLQTQLQSSNLKVGETVRLTTRLKNTQAEGQPMTLAIVGLPTGLSPQPWQLKELKEKEVFDFYEIIDHNLVLYYRQMAPNEEKVVNLDLKADLPGIYDAPASRAYLYYTDEHKHWTSMARVVIEE